MGLLIVLVMSLQQRKQELAILRTMGASPLQIALLLMLEALVITVSGVCLGMGLMVTLGYGIEPLLEEKMGLVLSLNTLSIFEVYVAIGVVLFGIVTSFVPAVLAYRKGLTQGFHSL